VSRWGDDDSGHFSGDNNRVYRLSIALSRWRAWRHLKTPELLHITVKVLTGKQQAFLFD
jgi:hypothetical protein